MLFVVGAGLLAWGVFQGVLPFTLAGVAGWLAFGGLVAYHVRLGRERRRAAALLRINDEATRRLRREWQGLSLRHGADLAETGHPYAGDVDLFGRASLFHLLEGGLGTGFGERTLSDWLANGARQAVDPREIGERQAAVAELAPLLDFRQELVLRARLNESDGEMDADGEAEALPGSRHPNPEPFLGWAESEPWLRRRQAGVWAARLSPVGLVGLLAAQTVGAVAQPLWVPFLLLNLLLAWRLGAPAYHRLDRITNQEGAFRTYAESFEVLAGATFGSARLRDIQARLRVDGHAAHEHVWRLHRLSRFVIPASAQVHLVLQVLLLWDVHVLWALEGWQARVGRYARSWLSTLGEAEALAALAGLAHDEPGWALPGVDPGTESLRVRQLGHPLLAAEQRVANDVVVGPAGTVLLVTGSNMSGKSTLLRSIALNAVLAQAGGPVCAAALEMPPVRLWTSMRVQDSLERGVSYFMAELLRLKQVVDASRADGRAGDRKGAVGGDAHGGAGAVQNALRGGEQVSDGQGADPAAPRLLYLLDEILHGTNTAERQIAARRIILYLVRQGAIGAVSTHDLTLVAEDAPKELVEAVRPVHFRETFTEGPDGPRMGFDYVLRPGLATSTNALRLMRIVGLDI